MRSSGTSRKLKISSRGDLRRPGRGWSLFRFRGRSDRVAATLTHVIHRFGHGTVKMVRQAQSREKLLQKKLEEGLTEKPQRDAEWDFSFPDPGQ